MQKRPWDRIWCCRIGERVRACGMLTATNTLILGALALPILDLAHALRRCARQFLMFFRTALRIIPHPTGITSGACGAQRSCFRGFRYPVKEWFSLRVLARRRLKRRSKHCARHGPNATYLYVFAADFTAARTVRFLCWTRASPKELRITQCHIKRLNSRFLRNTMKLRLNR